MEEEIVVINTLTVEQAQHILLCRKAKSITFIYTPEIHERKDGFYLGKFDYRIDLINSIHFSMPVERFNIYSVSNEIPGHTIPWVKYEIAGELVSEVIVDLPLYRHYEEEFRPVIKYQGSGQGLCNENLRLVCAKVTLVSDQFRRQLISPVKKIITFP